MLTEYVGSRSLEGPLRRCFRKNHSPPDDKATIALHASLNQSKAQQENQSETVGQSVTESGKIYKQGFLWCSTFLSHVNHYLFPSQSLVVVPKNAPRL